MPRQPHGLVMALTPAGKQFVHLVCRFSFQRGQDMAVSVHRQTDLGVAQDLHDHPRRDVLDEQQRRAGVAEVVKAPLR